MTYIPMQKWRSDEMIAVNPDLVLTIESTNYSPPACRLNRDPSLIVAGNLGEVMFTLNGHGPAEVTKQRRRRGPNKIKATKERKVK